MKRLLFLSIMGLAVNCGMAQPDEDPDFDRLIESIFSVQSEDIHYADLYESYLHFYQNPLNINTCTREDLQSLYILSNEEVIRLLDHRQEYGDFFSLYELYHIENIDSSSVQLLIPFLAADYSGRKKNDSIPFIKRLNRFSRNSLILRYSRLIEPKQGLMNRRLPGALSNMDYFLGQGNYYYARFQMDLPGDFRMGFTVENDPGEAFYFNMGSGSYGFDHLAGYIQFSNRGIIKNFVVGNFQFHAGQGLVAGSGFFTGKGSETVSTIRRADRGIIPYQGSSEYGFFRGIGFTLGGKKLDFSGFFSHKFEDGIVEYEEGRGDVIRSLLKTGYHRTPLEFDRKNNVVAMTYGSRLRYRSIYRNFTAGLIAVNNHFNQPLQERDLLYNRFDVQGRDHLVSGLYYNYYKGKFNIFGEAAMTGEKGVGFVQGLIANLSPEFETSLHFRSFGVRYFSFYGSTFGDSQINRNEYGIYWGSKLIPYKRIELDAFIDVYKKNWLTSRAFAPSMGYEWMGRLRWKLSEENKVEVRYREDHSTANYSPESISTEIDSGDSGYTGENSIGLITKRAIPDDSRSFYEYTVTGQVRKSYGIAWTMQQRNGLYLKSRLQLNVHRSESSSTGLAVAQDIGYNRRKFPMNQEKYAIRSRIAWFNTGSYDTRQYMYEHDVLYYFSVPLYYGEGVRYYLTFKYALSDHFNLWFKGGRFHYFDREGTGSGLDYIDGNKKTEIRCQVQMKF